MPRTSIVSLPLKEKSNVLDVICTAAKKEDEIALKSLFEKWGHFNFYVDGCTPIMKLAEEGCFATVDLLLNKFSGSYTHAVEGYIRGEHFLEVDKWLNAGMISLSHMVQSYARHGYFEKVDALIKNGADRRYAIEGYACGGYIQQVEETLKKDIKYYNYAVRGYAYAGNKDKVEELIEKGAGLHYAIQGYAEAGLIKEVEYLLNRFGPGDNNVNVNCALNGYATSGNIQQVNQYISQYTDADIDCAILNYAAAGYISEVEDLLQRQKNKLSRDIDDMVQEMANDYRQAALSSLKNSYITALYGYAFGGFLYEVDTLLNLCLKEQKIKDKNQFYQWIVNGCAKMNDLSSQRVCFLMSVTKHRPLKKIYYKQLPKNTWESLDELMLRSSKLSGLMNKNGLTYNQAQYYLDVAVHYWLFILNKIVINDKKIPLEVCCHILSFLIGDVLNYRDKIINTANQRVGNRVWQYSQSIIQNNISQAHKPLALQKTEENIRQICFPVDGIRPDNAALEVNKNYEPLINIMTRLIKCDWRPYTRIGDAPKTIIKIANILKLSATNRTKLQLIQEEVKMTRKRYAIISFVTQHAKGRSALTEKFYGIIATLNLDDLNSVNATTEKLERHIVPDLVSEPKKASMGLKR